LECLFIIPVLILSTSNPLSGVLFQEHENQELHMLIYVDVCVCVFFLWGGGATEELCV